ncbi:MAG: DNA repair protein RecO [Deltaproteobacteria bacterium]|nr:DNA repair protein RecO [Deltaproteobacteria bacterium]
MRTLHTEALVLRVVEFGESDLILHLLTPETSRLTAIARHARRSRKRFAGTLDLFNRLRITAVRRSGSAMARLEQATLVESLAELRRDTARFALGCYLLELLGRLAPEGGARADSRRLFAFTLSALRALDARSPDARLRVLLELRALDALGLRPELEACVRCGGALEGSEEVPFLVAEGGPLCTSCAAAGEDALGIHLGTLRALAVGLRFAPEQLGRVALSGPALREARLLLSRFARFHVGLELQSERFLNEIISSADLPAG